MRESTRKSLVDTQNYINLISNELIQNFKEVIAGDCGLNHGVIDTEVFLLDIEVFTDGYGLTLYPSDGDSTQLGYKKLLERFSNGPFRDNDYTYGIDPDSYDFDNEEDLNEIDEYYNLLTKLYFEWISTCWDEAGGESFLTPIYVMMHDGSESFDLCQKQWITDVIKWQQ